MFYILTIDTVHTHTTAYMRLWVLLYSDVRVLSKTKVNALSYSLIPMCFTDDSFFNNPSKNPVVCLSKKRFPTCTVLSGHRYGFERDFRIELMGDWLKCQKSPYLLFFWPQVKWNSISHRNQLMFFLFYVFFKDLNKKVLSLTNWWNYTVLKSRLKQFDTNIKTIKLLFHNLLFFRTYATNNDVAIQTVNISIFIPFLNFFKPLKV